MHRMHPRRLRPGDVSMTPHGRLPTPSTPHPLFSPPRLAPGAAHVGKPARPASPAMALAAFACSTQALVHELVIR